ncbi:unnamed protein product [Colletotrichum noveboracense]|uniref:Uncharacterized protein n=1 Tax=Colletotrichum noveboracense TaxID=2664923 RepID=A0A9W4RMB1_9PEZI|nr:unnamed protein product [Colletotrichum noveboracense]
MFNKTIDTAVCVVNVTLRRWTSAEMKSIPDSIFLLLSLSTLAQCDPVELRPSEEFARRRGPQIFNAVHDSMRQWGSSLHHNGMSFFPATVPAGVLLYHGNNSPNSPSEPDWLAYEIEHAEEFARGRPSRPPGGGPPRGPPGGPPPPPAHEDADQQQVLGGRREKRAEGEGGYLHVYRASEDLHLLYVDGMSGGKTSMGTLDSQDYLLRGSKTDSWADPDSSKVRGGGPMGERERAVELCDLVKPWGLHGILRMEAGFEIIMCDFTNGLEQVQAQRRSSSNRRNDRNGGINRLETLRGWAERYQGIGASRTLIDYSSMVSAFFYPVNLTNPNESRPDLPRLSYVSEAELEVIKNHVHEAIESSKAVKRSPVDWQGISDLIVGRFADRIEFMASTDSSSVLLEEINFILDVFINYPGDDGKPDLAEAASLCRTFYLQIMTPSTEADRLLYASFKTVTSEICSTLFGVREKLSSSSQISRSDVKASTEAMRSLMDFLGWSRFKRCTGCSLDEVCFIPMWPMGSKEDYYHPSCKNGSSLHDGESYWKM